MCKKFCFKITVGNRIDTPWEPINSVSDITKLGKFKKTELYQNIMSSKSGHQQLSTVIEQAQLWYKQIEREDMFLHRTDNAPSLMGKASFCDVFNDSMTGECSVETGVRSALAGRLTTTFIGKIETEEIPAFNLTIKQLNEQSVENNIRLEIDMEPADDFVICFLREEGFSENEPIHFCREMTLTKAKYLADNITQSILTNDKLNSDVYRYTLMAAKKLQEWLDVALRITHEKNQLSSRFSVIEDDIGYAMEMGSKQYFKKDPDEPMDPTLDIKVSMPSYHLDLKIRAEALVNERSFTE